MTEGKNGTDVDLVATGATTFTGLTDTPSSYAAANALYAVNAAANGVVESDLTYSGGTLTTPAVFNINDGTRDRIKFQSVDVILTSGDGTTVLDVDNNLIRFTVNGNIFDINTDGIIQSTHTFSNTVADSVNLTVNSAGLVRRSTSSRKIKDAILYDSVDPAWALQFKPVTFNEKSSDNRHVGFIAEDMRDIDSRFASDGGKDDLPGLELNAIVAALTATVQAQQKRIEELEAA
ncbi:MAG: tail fiber domain-containing protein [Proteobacteria bacterium]|nr:tail fiber domain-containing protein [Pseudomonadota bacterium]